MQLSGSYESDWKSVDDTKTIEFNPPVLLQKNYPLKIDNFEFKLRGTQKSRVIRTNNQRSRGTPDYTTYSTHVKSKPNGYTFEKYYFKPDYSLAATRPPLTIYQEDEYDYVTIEYQMEFYNAVTTHSYYDMTVYTYTQDPTITSQYSNNTIFTNTNDLQGGEESSWKSFTNIKPNQKNSFDVNAGINNQVGKESLLNSYDAYDSFPSLINNEETISFTNEGTNKVDVKYRFDWEVTAPKPTKGKVSFYVKDSDKWYETAVADKNDDNLEYNHIEIYNDELDEFGCIDVVDASKDTAISEYRFYDDNTNKWLAPRRISISNG